MIRNLEASGNKTLSEVRTDYTKPTLWKLEILFIKKYLEFLDSCFIDQENNNYNKLDIWFPDPQ